MKIHFPVVNKEQTQLGESFGSPDVESHNLSESKIAGYPVSLKTIEQLKGTHHHYKTN